MSSSLSAHLFMILWAALVASSFPVAALFNAELSATLLVAIRFIFAGVLMWIFRPPNIKVTLKSATVYSTLGLLLASNFVIMFVALRTAEPLNLAALFILQPLFAYLISWLVRLEVLHLQRMAALISVAFATLIILSRSDLSKLMNVQFGFGEQIYLIACLLSASYNVLSRLATDRSWIAADPYTTTCLSLIGGGLLIAIPDLFYTDFTQFFTLISTTDLVALGYLTLFTSLATFWILQVCALRLAPSMLAAYGYQAPLLYLLAELLFGLTDWQNLYGLAIAILLTSFILLSREKSLRVAPKQSIL